MHSKLRWLLPYIDQPISFWDTVACILGERPFSVYFPWHETSIGSGRPKQQKEHLAGFLEYDSIKKSLLLNPIIHTEPVSIVKKRLITVLEKLHACYGVSEAIVTDPLIGKEIHNNLPYYSLSASCLMDIASPEQLPMIGEIFDSITPSGRIIRNIAALRQLRENFRGSIRLMVNEGCLPGCPHRIQHFHEMNSGLPYPESLCSELFKEKPWLSLLGAWILPQHLHHYDGIYDEVKLAGRVTLRHPETYLRVVRAYVHQEPLQPFQIGGGPAMAPLRMQVSDEYFQMLLSCSKSCHVCEECKNYYELRSSQGADYHKNIGSEPSDFRAK